MQPEAGVIPTTNSVSGAASQAHRAVDNLADKTVPAVQSATAAAHQTIDKVATAGAAATEWAATTGKDLMNKSTAIAEACSGQVRARPLTSMAGALVVGYIFGRLLR
jgi:ElaB/YqjD/DUF883 family membrane-anchored ribosome-binding protein